MTPNELLTLLHTAEKLKDATAIPPAAEGSAWRSIAGG